MERRLRLRLPGAVVQPDRNARPLGQPAVPCGSGIVSSQRDAVSAPFRLHADTQLSLGVALAPHFEIENGIRNQTGYGFHGQRVDTPGEQSVELRLQRPVVQSPVSPLLPADLPGLQRRWPLPGANSSPLGAGVRLRLPGLHHPSVGCG